MKTPQMNTHRLFHNFSNTKQNKSVTCSPVFNPVFSLVFSLVLIHIIFLPLNFAYAQVKASVVAIVDGTAISSIDLENKVQLLLLSTNKSAATEDLEQYRSAALEMLIDETLKIQAAQAINPNSFTEATASARSFFENAYSLQNLTASERLQAAGIPVSTAIDQIKADIVWTGVLTNKFRHQFSQIQSLAEAEQQRLLNDLSAPQYNISEIVLMPIPSRPLEQTRTLSEQLLNAIAKGAEFNAIAAQYSMSGSAKNGGKVGWVQAKKLPADIQNSMDNARLEGEQFFSIQSGELIYIFKIDGYRKLGFNDPSLDVISIGRAVLMLAENVSEDEKNQKISQLETDTKNITSCSDLKTYHESLGSDVLSQINNVKIENLETSFQEMILKLDIDTPSEVIQTNENELAIFMVCSRSQQEPDIPTIEQLNEVEFNKLYSVLSMRYLMRLRRAASIEIKM